MFIYISPPSGSVLYTDAHFSFWNSPFSFCELIDELLGWRSLWLGAKDVHSQTISHSQLVQRSFSKGETAKKDKSNSATTTTITITTTTLLNIIIVTVKFFWWMVKKRGKRKKKRKIEKRIKIDCYFKRASECRDGWQLLFNRIAEI